MSGHPALQARETNPHKGEIQTKPTKTKPNKAKPKSNELISTKKDKGAQLQQIRNQNQQIQQSGHQTN